MWAGLMRLRSRAMKPVGATHIQSALHLSRPSTQGPMRAVGYRAWLLVGAVGECVSLGGLVSWFGVVSRSALVSGVRWGWAAYQPLCDPFARLRHEVALKFVTADNDQDVTQCSAIGTLPRRATGAIRW